MILEVRHKLNYMIDDIFAILKDDQSDPTQPKGIDPFIEATMADIDKALQRAEDKLLNKIESAIYQIDPEDADTVYAAERKISGAIRKYGTKAASLSTDEIYSNSETLYKNVKSTLSNKMGFGEPTFMYPDEMAINRVNKLQDVFIDGHFRDDVSAKAAKVIRDVVNESQTLSKAEVAKKLMEAMPDIVKSRAYFETVANQVLGNARSYSSMRFYQDARIKSFQVIAVMDQRTSRQCRFMNGMILDVGTALSRYSLYDQAQTGDDIKQVNPWIATLTNGGMTVNGVAVSDSMTGADLQALGLNAPPYHGNCRTTVSPVF